MEKIKIYLSEIAGLDWKELESLDFKAHALEIMKVLNTFKTLLQEAQKNQDLNYREIKETINSYAAVYSKIQHDHNLFLKKHLGIGSMVTNLLDCVNQVEFEQALSKNENSCGCGIRMTFHKDPLFEYLFGIGKGLDGYYSYEVHQCKKCSEMWVAYIADDDSGKQIWQKWDEKEFPVT